MWRIIGLLSLCSVLCVLSGCGPINASQRHEKELRSNQGVAEITDADLDELLGEQNQAPQQLPPVAKANSLPDPLAAEPPALKGAGRMLSLFVYGGDWCSPCRLNKPHVLAFANEMGLTHSEANIPNANLARVRFADITRDKVVRTLPTVDGQTLYPVTMIVDERGRMLWHRVGVLENRDWDELRNVWSALSR